MKGRGIAGGLAIAAVLWGAGELRSQDEEVKTFPFDKGPETIDVSSYPKEQQDNYPVFAEKCSKCHTLARPINSPFALPEEWDAYVHKMQHKKRSGVDADSAKTIIDFLSYDSSVRKKEILAKKIQEKKDGKYDLQAVMDAAEKQAQTAAPKDESQPKEADKSAAPQKAETPKKGD